MIAHVTKAGESAHAVIEAILHVPGVGVWFADVTLADDPDLSGNVTLTLGQLTLVGTIESNAAFGARRRMRIVAGANGWGKLLGPKAYHNDAGGVVPKTVVADAATEAGETLGTFGVTSKFAVDYARSAGPASSTIIAAATLNALTWWVDFAGVTQVQARPTPATPTTGIEILDFTPSIRIATLSVDDLALIAIGLQLKDPRLAETLTIRSFSVRLTADKLRVEAYCGTESTTSPIVRALKAIHRRADPPRLYGVYRYRVVAMSSDRVELQAISPRVPSILPISQWPGLAGSHAILTPGTEVLVQFVAGSPDEPVITGYVGKGGPGAIPVSVSLCGGTKPASGIGDTVSVLMPPLVPVSGTLSGAPFTGTMTITTPAIGIIQSGSPKVLV